MAFSQCNQFSSQFNLWLHLVDSRSKVTGSMVPMVANTLASLLLLLHVAAQSEQKHKTEEAKLKPPVALAFLPSVTCV